MLSRVNNVSKKIGSVLCTVVGNRTPIGVYMEKGIDALCVFLGTVYAGAFYSLFNTKAFSAFKDSGKFSFFHIPPLAI